MISDISFCPIGDDEPDLPTCAILKVTIKDLRKSFGDDTYEDVICYNMLEVHQTIKRLKRSLAAGQVDHRVYYDRADQSYKYVVNAATASKLVNQLVAITKL